MARSRTVYHVAPDATADQWVITIENRDAFRQRHRTKNEAVEAAKARARRHEPSQVKVHLANGNMEYESTYGEDPPESPS